MLLKNSSDELANLFMQCRTSQTNSRQFSLLEKGFMPKIKQLASKYSNFWNEDFIQEGRIGLLKAFHKFPETSDCSQFENYASLVISNQMIDFYRHVIGKSLVEITEVDFEGNASTYKQPIFINPPVYTSEEDDSLEYILNFPSQEDYVTSTTLTIDFNLCLNKNVMQKNNFTDKEIKVFDLHFNKGYNVTEVAEKINLSISQTSKIISKTKPKVQQLLAYTSNNNLN